MNFCAQSFDTRIESSCVCSDGFDVNNLLEFGKTSLTVSFSKSSINFKLNVQCLHMSSSKDVARGPGPLPNQNAVSGF